MQLDQNEHSIFGYFSSIAKAEQAMEELKQADLVPGEGYMQIDTISRHGVENDSEYNNPINNASALHGLTYHSSSDGADDVPNPLLAADDSESGRGVYDDNFAGKSVMVVLVTDKDNVEKAVQIMKKHDGYV